MSDRQDQPADADETGDHHARTRARDVARNEGISNLQALQRVLYRSAKQDPTRKFHALYDKLTRSPVMWQAWVNVARNQGSPVLPFEVAIAAQADPAVEAALRKSVQGQFLEDEADWAAEAFGGSGRPNQ